MSRLYLLLNKLYNKNLGTGELALVDIVSLNLNYYIDIPLDGKVGVSRLTRRRLVWSLLLTCVIV